MTLCLTRAELQELTGRSTRPAQLRVLARQGLPALVDGRGHVKVLRAALERRQGIAGRISPVTEPDFEALAARG
ncbi:MAG TPA: DUF4224 domain-containing protein [Burkholderiales bacterium]